MFPHWKASLSLILLLAFAGSAPAAPDWKIVKISGREYLTADNIAAFYGLPTGAKPIENRLRIDNGNSSLEFQLGSREVMINGVRNWLCFPVTEKDGEYLVSRVDLAKTLEPQLRPQMIPNLGQFKTVVVDAGHGGSDKGAISSYGYEKDFALDVARNIKPLLEAKGLNVKMTRDSDIFVPLELRARIANATKDSIFVSIHFNATNSNPSANGFEIFSLTPRGAPSTDDDALALRFMNMEAGSPVDAPSLALSMSVYHSVVGHFSEFDRGIKRARFAVLRLTRIPAILVEGGFLTERGESRMIAKSAWRAKLAQSIATGIVNYKGLVDNKAKPMMVADYRRQFEGQLVLKDASAPAKPEASSAPAVIPTSN
ncbi:MAG: N-acetylmuramoyl-L-alanine amidase [Chthoniobacterales bacterium]|nr:N-acetylmuramoyl-L-alanine amidase [Chthoniobacterales bacterium]